MTLLGFDGLTDALLVPKPEWDVTTSWQSTQTGRSSDTDGAASAPNSATAFKTYTMSSACATVFYGVGFNVVVAGAIGTAGAGSFQLGAMLVGGVVQCIVGTNTSGFIEVRRGTVWSTGTIIATSSGHTPIGAGAWHQAEVKGLMHTSTGQVVVKLDGIQVIDTGSVQTAATAGSVNALRFGSGTGTVNAFQYDDLYVCDAVDATATQGQANNTFLGDVRVQVLVPTGVGDTTQWTPSSAVANWTTVDEIPPNTTDYNSDAVSGHRDLYGLADLSGAVGTIFGVQEGLYASKVEAGTAGIKPLLKENAVVTSDASQGVSTGFAPVWAAMRAVKPSNNTAWTVTDVNALQAGAEVA